MLCEIAAPGKRGRSQRFSDEVAELQVRAVVLNRFTRLSTPVTVEVL